MRIVFVNLHGNEFLVKTLSKIVYRQSVAVKHKYLLDYLLSNPDIEVCSLINRYGFSLSYASAGSWLRIFRFLEHKIAIKKNNIDPKKITVLKDVSELRPDDIVILYRYYHNQMLLDHRPDCFMAVSMIHFGNNDAELLRDKLKPNAMFNESDLSKYSSMHNLFFDWFDGDFIVQPFVFAERFHSYKPFAERQNKAVSVGTITYMHNITPYYGDSCAQPARKQIKDNAAELVEYLDCFNSDYMEDAELKKELPSDWLFTKFYKRVYNRFNSGRQKKYYSFNMVDKFNDYKMCVVGEEIMGIPGVGFVEGMACGCAYIGQTIGYYEDYGMQEGVHYIGYDGTLDDLKAKIAYYQQPEHQSELEQIAKVGCEFVREHFNGEAVARKFISDLQTAQQKWLNSKV